MVETLGDFGPAIWLLSCMLWIIPLVSTLYENRLSMTKYLDVPV